MKILKIFSKGYFLGAVISSVLLLIFESLSLIICDPKTSDFVSQASVYLSILPSIQSFIHSLLRTQKELKMLVIMELRYI